VIFAAQVNGKVAAGDTSGALDSAKKAKMFSFIAIGVGLAGIICYILIWVIWGVAMVAGTSSSNF
ncbi:MAG TPA: CD225/dispanin family protein, partial [Pyrinomonadaceae bacterium]|nr:CD225/dispanin family protein [Pyrinomonadaceae bacterium]